MTLGSSDNLMHPPAGDPKKRRTIPLPSAPFVQQQHFQDQHHHHPTEDRIPTSKSTLSPSMGDHQSVNRLCIRSSQSSQFVPVGSILHEPQHSAPISLSQSLHGG